MQSSFTGLVTCMNCGKKMVQPKFILHQYRCPQSFGVANEVQKKISYQQKPKKEQLNRQNGKIKLSRQSKTLKHKKQHQQEHTSLYQPKEQFANPQNNTKISSTKPHYTQHKQQKQGAQVDDQIIPCVQCGELVLFCLYAEHERQCMGRDLRQCDYCGLKFPKILFQQHLGVCQFRQQAQQNSSYADFDLELQNHISRIASQELKEDEEIIGLTSSQIQHIKVLSNYVKEDDCSICYSTMKKGQKILQLYCKHLFHKQCLVPWVKANPHCPMCKADALGRK